MKIFRLNALTRTRTRRQGPIYTDLVIRVTAAGVVFLYYMRYHINDFSYWQIILPDSPHNASAANSAITPY